MSLTFCLQVATRAVIGSGSGVHEEIESKIDVRLYNKEAEACSSESVNAVCELGGKRDFVSSKSKDLVNFLN